MSRLARVTRAHSQHLLIQLAAQLDRLAENASKTAQDARRLGASGRHSHDRRSGHRRAGAAAASSRQASLAAGVPSSDGRSRRTASADASSRKTKLIIPGQVRGTEESPF